MRAAEIEAVAAQEFEAWRAAGDREAHRERAVLLAVAGEARRINRDLVRQRPQGGEDAGAPYHDPGARLFFHLQRGAFFKVEHAGYVAAALKVDQRMSQHDVVLAQMLDIAAHVLAEFRPLLAVVVGGGAPG